MFDLTPASDMDFEFSEEQEALRSSARRFLEQRYPLDVVARTADGGMTWGTPRQVLPGSLAASFDGHVLLVDPRTSTLYVVYWSYHNSTFHRTVTRNACRKTKDAARCISAVVSTRWTVTPNGSGKSLGPETRTTSAPRV